VRERTPTQTYAALQKLAREQGRTSQQLFELYVHERFLARLAASPLAQRFRNVVGAIVDFLDGSQLAGVARWSPSHSRWEQTGA
jgi:hypothetical protein